MSYRQRGCGGGAPLAVNRAGGCSQRGRRADRAPPYAIAVSVTGLQDAVVAGEWSLSGAVRADRAEHLLPFVTVDDTDDGAVVEALRPAMDALWQAFGVEGVPPHSWQV
jgi:hypothetical protein